MMSDSENGDLEAVYRLFDRLVDRSAAEREAALAESGESPAVVDEVRALLSADQEVGILDRPSAPLQPDESWRTLEPGTRIGGFVIESFLGRGGMGEVYRARRSTTDFDQYVALKLLRREAAERGDLFERERRLLAGLDHPGIARLIDGGVSADGQPYMAMEFVDGAPIDQWCRRHAASLDTRLRLMREVCAAVGYAHANLVVHRDLKPSNVMVDSRGSVRLLDFGIARLIDDSPSHQTATMALLTPDFAAPEQLSGEAVTVATDVYALGALMFVLLSGTNAWRGGNGALPAIMRRVLDEAPPAPSKAAARTAEAPVPPHRLAGDLDAIVLKAMRREPRLRYRSAADLGDDIERHQNLLPVEARAGSRRYAVSRFVRRHRWAVASAVAVSIALLAAGGMILWQSHQKDIERDRAVAEARRSDAINRMLTVMVRDARDRGGQDGGSVKAMIDETAANLVESLDRSAASAALLQAVSILYLQLEDPRGAEALLERALARGIAADNAGETARMRVWLARLKALLNQPDAARALLAQAEPLLRRDPEQYRAEQLDIVITHALLERYAGDPVAGRKLLQANIPAAERAYAGDPRELISYYGAILVAMLDSGGIEDFPAVYARADATIARLGRRHSLQGVGLLQQRGIYLIQTDRTVEAETVLADAVAQRRALSAPNAGLATGLMQLGRAQLLNAKPREAAASAREAEMLSAKANGPSAPITLSAALVLAEATARLGDFATAERAIGRAAPGVARLGARTTWPGTLARVRAVLLLEQGRFDEALRACERAEALVRMTGPRRDKALAVLARLRAEIAARRST